MENLMRTVETPRMKRAMNRILDRKGPYWSKISAKLSELSVNVLDIMKMNAGMINYSSDIWEFDHASYSLVAKVCELCGHNPIYNLFYIKNKTSGKVLMIGSECAVNYLGIDIVKAISKLLGQGKEKIKNEAIYEAEIAYANAHVYDKDDNYYARSAMRSLLWKVSHGRKVDESKDYDLSTIRRRMFGEVLPTIINAIFPAV